MAAPRAHLVAPRAYIEASDEEGEAERALAATDPRRE